MGSLWGPGPGYNDVTATLCRKHESAIGKVCLKALCSGATITSGKTYSMSQGLPITKVLLLAISSTTDKTWVWTAVWGQIPPPQAPSYQYVCDTNNTTSFTGGKANKELSLIIIQAATDLHENGFGRTNTSNYTLQNSEKRGWFYGLYEMTSPFLFLLVLCKSKKMEI